MPNINSSLPTSMATMTKTKTNISTVTLAAVSVAVIAGLLGFFTGTASYSMMASPGVFKAAGGKPTTESLQVYLAPLPAAQKVISGTQGHEFAGVVIDASLLKDDVEVRGLNLTVSVADGAQLTDVNNLTLVEDGIVMSDSLDPAQILSFNLINSFIVKAGMTRTLLVIGDVNVSATDGSYKVGIQKFTKSLKLEPVETNYVDSNKNLKTIYQYDAGRTMSFTAQGTLTINRAPSTLDRLVLANATIELNRIKLTATNEDMIVRELSLCVQDGGVNNGSEAGDSDDIAEFMVFKSTDPSAPILTGVISSGQMCRRFNVPVGALIVPKDSANGIQLIINGVMANVGVNNPGTAGADVKVGIGGPNGVNAVGMNSGVSPEKNYVSSTSTIAKLQLAYPRVSLNVLPSSHGLTPGSVISDFSLTNSTNNPLVVYRLSFLTRVFSDPDLDVITASLIDQSSGKAVALTQTGVVSANDPRSRIFSFVLMDPDNFSQGQPYQIGAGQTVRFQLIAKNLLGVDSIADGMLATHLIADQAINVSEADMGVVNIAAFYQPDNDGNFVWSDLWLDDAWVSTASASPQWWNGYLVDGLSSSANSAQFISE